MMMMWCSWKCKNSANSVGNYLRSTGKLTRQVEIDGQSATICTVHSVNLLTSRADRNLSGSAQRTRLQIQERLRMTKQLAHLHDGEQGLVRGGLARQARKAWRIGSQAVGVEVDGTGAWLRRSRRIVNHTGLRKLFV